MKVLGCQLRFLWSIGNAFLFGSNAFFASVSNDGSYVFDPFPINVVLHIYSYSERKNIFLFYIITYNC